jgi:tetratricopeptide (TPR) repeat protein
MLRKTILLLALLLAGCGQNMYSQGRRFIEDGQYDRAISFYYQQIADSPRNMEAWRELGVAFYKQGNYEKAEDALKQANEIQVDPRSSFYLGLAAEQQGMTDKAINAYRAALAVSPDREMKGLLQAHLDQLLSARVQGQAAAALANEQEISADSIPPNTIAVVDFNGAYVDSSLRPLAVGLAEFTANDLSKVKSLRVVERMKIEAILDEMKMAQSGAVDPASAPRVGRLLGGRNVVTGNLLGIGNQRIRLDGVIVNSVDSTTTQTEPTEEDVQQIFKAQKALVFSIIDDLGIHLTQAERDAIAEVPTESYLALLNFSRGLEYKRAGMMPEAEAAFNDAAAADPGFGEARAASATVSASISLSGDPTLGGFERAVGGLEEPPTLAFGLDSRLTRTISNTVGGPEGTTRRPVIRPPVVDETATVNVKGDLDGK